MKKIKIRFVEYYDKEGVLKGVETQEKRWYGWETLSYTMCSYGGECYINYYEPTKEKLLEVLLNRHYKNCSKHLTIIEYPSLKIY
ncbi:MAG: hypothetical protein ABFD07_01915 [Methanobacterium sp.]